MVSCVLPWAVGATLSSPRVEVVFNVHVVQSHFPCRLPLGSVDCKIVVAAVEAIAGMITRVTATSTLPTRNSLHNMCSDHC